MVTSQAVFSFNAKGFQAIHKFLFFVLQSLSLLLVTTNLYDFTYGHIILRSNRRHAHLLFGSFAII